MIESKKLLELGREYALYTISDRALGHITDGLKPSTRRTLWKARDGKKLKTASLAGATMSIHPHMAPEGAINTAAGFHVNNIPLFSGSGAFGTLINPQEYGSGRYTSINTSKFTNDVMLADLPIIPMVDSYDGNEQEPKHFLPLIPIAMLNPLEGIASGYSSDILPRDLVEIINEQLKHLKGKKVSEVLPTFYPLKTKAKIAFRDKKDVLRYKFHGKFEKHNTTTITVTNIPYGLSHANYIKRLDKMEEANNLISYVDKSRDTYKIELKFKRGFIGDITDDEIMVKIGLEMNITENMNLIDFNGTSVKSTNFTQVIEEFTDWRLTWYVTRYERLKRLLEEDIQRYKDVIMAIRKNVGSLAKKTESRIELKELLEMFDIVNLDYIADLPIYRFTEAEKEKTKLKLAVALKQLKEYNKILSKEDLRIDLYVTELKTILDNKITGKYD